MTSYAYQIVNVFAESRFGGNPLAVFTDARGLSDDDMQRIARQFNLSETVFLLPDEYDEAVAALRIFTPSYELPFAGHPTIGSAAVLHRLFDPGEHFSLRTQAGLIPIRVEEGVFHLTAVAATQRAANLAVEDTAAMLGLAVGDIAGEAMWVNAGSEQLLIRLASREAVLAAQPDHALFVKNATLRPGRSIAYLWFEEGGVVSVRLFFEQHGAIVEDPGTGSACANLGGWCVLNGLGALQWRVEQGAVMNRPNVLYLTVDAQQRVHVGGKVSKMGEGVFELPVV